MLSSFPRSLRDPKIKIAKTNLIHIVSAQGTFEHGEKSDCVENREVIQPEVEFSKNAQSITETSSGGSNATIGSSLAEFHVEGLNVLIWDFREIKFELLKSSRSIVRTASILLCFCKPWRIRHLRIYMEVRRGVASIWKVSYFLVVRYFSEMRIFIFGITGYQSPIFGNESSRLLSSNELLRVQNEKREEKRRQNKRLTSSSSCCDTLKNCGSQGTEEEDSDVESPVTNLLVHKKIESDLAEKVHSVSPYWHVVFECTRIQPNDQHSNTNRYKNSGQNVTTLNEDDTCEGTCV